MRRSTHTAAALLVAVASMAGAALLGCSPAEDPEPDVAELDFEPVAEVGVDEDGFDPARLELEQGDTIVLVNEGERPHSFTSTEPTFRDTGAILPGEEVVLRFDAAGEVVGRDGEAPDHEITIAVAEAGPGPDAAAPG